tara:strand:+ start:144 stop:581 length:438 start_codon:yes stop_codon:yes gene_type:complete
MNGKTCKLCNSIGSIVSLIASVGSIIFVFIIVITTGSRNQKFKMCLLRSVIDMFQFTFLMSGIKSSVWEGVGEFNSVLFNFPISDYYCLFEMDLQSSFGVVFYSGILIFLYFHHCHIRLLPMDDVELIALRHEYKYRRLMVLVLW